MKDFLKTNKEIVVVWILFAISCVNRTGLFIATFCLLYYLWQGIEGCIKALILIAIRTPLNSVVAVSTSSLQSLKWILIFAFLGYLLLNFRCVLPKYRKFVSNVTLALFVFVVITAIGSWFCASYPVTALFKLASYFIATEGIMVGVASSKEPQKYIKFFIQVMTPIMILSFLTIGNTRFKTINDSFQGLFIHPNMFGIMGAIFICLYILYRKYYGRGHVLVIIMTIIMIYFAESRTGMISALVALILGYKHLLSEKYRKYGFVIILVVAIGAIFSWGTVSETISEFIFKHNSTEIFSSREIQIENFQKKFLNDPLLGSGFAVPYNSFVRDESLNMNLQVEPGNIAWAVIGDCGILGTFFFCLYLLSVLFNVKGSKLGKLILFIVPLIVSMGEMAFFSVNSIAPLYYLMFALYMVDLNAGQNEKLEEIVEETYIYD